MKLSHTTLLAILASSALVSAAPTSEGFQTTTTTVVKREDLNQVMEQLAELKNLKMKRDSLDENDDALVELERRADTVLGNLLSALANSGLISEVFNTLTSDTDLKNSILAIVKSALQAAVVQGPTLIKAVFNSGLISEIFDKILNDSDLRSALLAAGKSLFSSAFALIEKYIGSKTSGTTTTAVTAATTTTAASTTTAVAKREAVVNGDAGDIISERDLSSIVTYVVDEIKNSGLVSSLVNKVLADPSSAISFLTSALKKGVVVLEDVYSWAKSSGVLSEGISWLEKSDNSIIAELGTFLASSIGSGAVSSSEFDGTSSATVATTKVATATAITTTAATTASGDSDLGFLSKYAEAGATTLYKKRMVY